MCWNTPNLSFPSPQNFYFFPFLVNLNPTEPNSQGKTSISNSVCMCTPQISSIFIALLHCDPIISSHLRSSYTHYSYFSTHVFLPLRGVTSWKTGTSPKILGYRKICKDTSYSACIHFLRRNEWGDYIFFSLYASI